MLNKYEILNLLNEDAVKELENSKIRLSEKQYKLMVTKMTNKIRFEILNGEYLSTDIKLFNANYIARLINKMGGE